MTDSVVRAWRWGLAFVSLVGTLVGIALAPESPVRDLALWAVGIAVGATGVWSALALTASRLQAPALRVGNADTDAYLDEAYHFGSAVYRSINKHYPVESTVRRWRRKYQDAVYRAYDRRDHLWGYISVWPVSSDVFATLKSGGMPEDDLQESHIESKSSAPFQYWYVADICRRRRPSAAPREFSDYLVSAMIEGALRCLAEGRQLAPTVELVSFPATTAGEQLLRRLGFTEVAPSVPSPRVKRVYVRTLTETSRQHLLKECRFTMARNRDVVRRALDVPARALHEVAPVP